MKEKNTTKTSIKKMAHDMETKLIASVSIVVSIGQSAYIDMRLSKIVRFHF